MFDKIKLWIFDMDGTLTIPVHDFDRMRIDLGIPINEDILDYIAAQNSTTKDILYSKLHEIEVDYAKMGTAQPLVADLLSCLITMGRKVAVLTRNNHINTKTTLESAGLLQYFKEENIITREICEPKPSPKAILGILERTGTLPVDAIIVGDYKHDIEAGLSAGIHTLYFDSEHQGLWTALAERTITDFNEVLPSLCLNSR